MKSQWQVKIEKGNELATRAIQTEQQYSQFSGDIQSWSDRNEQLLGVLFTNSALKTRYRRSAHGVIVMSMDEPFLYKQIEDSKDDIRSKINVLRSVIDRIDLFPEPTGASVPTPTVQTGPVGRDVFIVHGHDTGTRETVARFIQALKLRPIILDEQANEGSTIIEKFERHAHGSVGFAVVLITPDDIGGKTGTPLEALKPRARQNIIFELGYFFAKLTRKYVVALYVEGTELPSDISGVLYIPVDHGGAWKLRLAKEMRTAGLPVDLNDAL
jgi:predicted nucleotide-binding protein